MLKEQQRFFLSILMVADLVLIVAAGVLAYVLRFHLLADIIPPKEQVFGYRSHAIPVEVAAPLMMIAMLWAKQYRPRRDQRFHREAGAIIKGTLAGVGLTIITLSLLRWILFGGRHYSGWQFLIYGAVTAGLLLTWRATFRMGLRALRRRGWNLRHVAIIGTGRLGQLVHHTLERNSWTGIKPSFFISHHNTTSRRECGGLPVKAGLSALEEILDAYELTGVFIAMPGRHSTQLPDLLSRLERYPLDVRVVPDMNPKFMPINMSVNELDGMPILSVRESPLNGWGRVAKRALDVAGSVGLLMAFGLPMLAIALAVRLSGGEGPVIFRQERMSLNGQRFKIFKFRTMRHVDDERQVLRDAGRGTDAWTRRDDPRITAVGRFLRNTSLDELPQLFNVLLGEMSLVGPRPERPELIERFREDWRGYMLRQNVKAGITGWAQVNGLRGDTSLRKRLQYDLFYIRNWSFAFDLRILWLTLFRGFAHPNAH
ncbi:MAG: undecaprenyl-phosphate glucose phosphotransferase [Planctomycetota bacterium]